MYVKPSFVTPTPKRLDLCNPWGHELHAIPQQVRIINAPGGFSAAGQPNDAFHNWLEMVRNAAQRAAMGIFRNPLRHAGAIQNTEDGR